MIYNLDLSKVKFSRIFEKANIRSLCENIKIELDERFCAYDGQYEDAKKIAEIVIEQYREGVEHKAYDFSFKTINADKLAITIVKNEFACNGEVKLENRTIYLDINIGEFYRYRSEEERLASITETIVHELMHCNITSYKPESYPWADFMYDVLDSITETPTIVWYFTYSLYCSYFQETQAFASGVSSEIDNLIMFRKPDKVDRNLLLSYLKDTSVYKNYYVIQHIYLPELKKINVIKPLCDIYRNYVRNKNYPEEESKEFNSFIDDLEKHYLSWIKLIETSTNRAFEKIKRNFNIILEKYLDI